MSGTDNRGLIHSPLLLLSLRREGTVPTKFFPSRLNGPVHTFLKLDLIPLTPSKGYHRLRIYFYSSRLPLSSSQTPPRRYWSWVTHFISHVVNILDLVVPSLQVIPASLTSNFSFQQLSLFYLSRTEYLLPFIESQTVILLTFCEFQKFLLITVKFIEGDRHQTNTTGLNLGYLYRKKKKRGVGDE